MSERPTKCRRTSANPFLDLEAAVEHDDKLEEGEDEEDRAFINDDFEGDDGTALQASVQRELVEYLQEDGQLDGSGAPEEQDQASLLREMLGLDLGEGDGGANPLVVDDETNKDEAEVVSAPRPSWTELGCHL